MDTHTTETAETAATADQNQIDHTDEDMIDNVVAPEAPEAEVEEAEAEAVEAAAEPEGPIEEQNQLEFGEIADYAEVGEMDEAQLEANEWRETFPNNTTKLRACMFCSRIKTGEQFIDQGCENCRFLEIAGDDERMYSCTSDTFSGMIGITDPQGSWVAKWQNIDRLKPGAYAISVSGTLPKEIQQVCIDAGKVYISRDTATKQ